MGRKPRDFSKEKIGHLQPLYIDETKPRGKGHNIYWICRCDCGNLVSRSSCNLQTAIRTKANANCGCITALKDLTGQKFGKLTVIQLNKELSSKPENDWRAYWDCQCECDNFCTVVASNLTRGHTTSCGCINYSIGEKNIENILKENNIHFQKEYSFPDLIGQDNHKLRFDFAILNDKNEVTRLIEFDGRQHVLNYTPWNSSETLEQRQARDEIKNTYCLKHHIPLVRIPYEERDKLTLQKLLIDTKYLIQENEDII